MFSVSRAWREQSGTTLEVEILPGRKRNCPNTKTGKGLERWVYIPHLLVLALLVGALKLLRLKYH